MTITTDQILFLLATVGIIFVVSRIIVLVGLLLEKFKDLSFFLKIIYGNTVCALILAAIIFTILIIQNPLKHHEENFSETARAFLLRFDIAAAGILTILVLVSNAYFLQKIKLFRIATKGIGLTFASLLIASLTILWYAILSLN